VYEGYAPGGVALLVTCLTDNRNRTAPDIKYIFDRGNGNLGSPGSVSFLFELRSQFVIEREGRDEDALTELALDVGADDVELDGEAAILQGSPNEFIALKRSLEERGAKFLSAELAYVPQSRVPVVSQDDARRVLRLIETLEANDDVQSVYANYDMPAEWLDELAG